VEKLSWQLVTESTVGLVETSQVSQNAELEEAEHRGVRKAEVFCFCRSSGPVVITTIDLLQVSITLLL
jgi:hypothetical protein